jgi:hypothetical protein
MTFREKIGEEIKQKRPNLNPSSLKTYISILFNLHKKLGDNDESIEWFDDDKKILEHLEDKSPQTRKTVLAALFILTGNENYQIYLNQANLARLQISKEAVGKVLEKSFKKQPGFAELVDMRETASSPIPSLYREMIANGYNQHRSGDFMYLLKPQWFSSSYKTGTTHSSLYAYDTHVPLLFFGWNVKPKEINQRTNISDISSTLANWLKINEPSGSIGKVIQ